MAVLLDWLIEGEVIYQHWWGLGTMDDVRFVNQRSLDLISKFPNRPLIHTIVNSLHQDKVEGGLQEIRKEYTGLDHPQTGWILMAIENPFIRFMGNIVVQMGRKTRIHIIKDVDNGVDWLKQVDSSINWDAADWSLLERFENEMNTKT